MRCSERTVEAAPGEVSARRRAVRKSVGHQHKNLCVSAPAGAHLFREGNSVVALAEKHCIPCEKGAEPLKGEEIEQRMDQLNPDWRVVDEHHLEREFTFKDFRQTLDFVNRVGELAEEEGHHPDICFGYGQAKIDLWTHKIDGLHENDFILAAKIDQIDSR